MFTSYYLDFSHYSDEVMNAFLFILKRMNIPYEKSDWNEKLFAVTLNNDEISVFRFLGDDCDLFEFYD